MSSESSNYIILISKDGQQFRVQRNIMEEMSMTIKNTLAESADEQEPVMPIPNIESKILEKVIEFCQYHHDKPKVELFRTPRGPLKGKLDELLCDYDKKFVNVEDKVLIDYMVASNYLEITEMLKVCSAKMGSDWQDMLSKDSFMEDFMERYNIPKDTFTSEEMNKLNSSDNKWIEENESY